MLYGVMVASLLEVATDRRRICDPATRACFDIRVELPSPAKPLRETDTD